MDRAAAAERLARTYVWWQEPVLTLAETFRSLSKAERQAIIDKLLADRRFREDLIDAAILEQRRREPTRPLKEYLAARPRRARG